MFLAIQIHRVHRKIARESQISHLAIPIGRGHQKIFQDVETLLLVA
jgi:hypothetical protein